MERIIRIGSCGDALRLGAILGGLLGLPAVTVGGVADAPLPTFSDGKASERVALISSVIKNRNVETDVICTNLDPTGVVNIGLEVFDAAGTLLNSINAGDGAILDVRVGGTTTIGTGSTAVLTENATIAALPKVASGTGRVVATSASVVCTALLVDRLHVIVAPGISSARPPRLARVPVWFCGNGTVEPLEECDDGNAASGDGCEPGCRTSSTTTLTLPPTTSTSLATTTTTVAPPTSTTTLTQPPTTSTNLATTTTTAAPATSTTTTLVPTLADLVARLSPVLPDPATVEGKRKTVARTLAILKRKAQANIEKGQGASGKQQARRYKKACNGLRKLIAIAAKADEKGTLGVSLAPLADALGALRSELGC